MNTVRLLLLLAAALAAPACPPDPDDPTGPPGDRPPGPRDRPFGRASSNLNTSATPSSLDSAMVVRRGYRG
jgi:hypothetical protein